MGLFKNITIASIFVFGSVTVSNASEISDLHFGIELGDSSQTVMEKTGLPLIVKYHKREKKIFGYVTRNLRVNWPEGLRTTLQNERNVSVFTLVCHSKECKEKERERNLDIGPFRFVDDKLISGRTFKRFENTNLSNDAVVQQAKRTFKNFDIKSESGNSVSFMKMSFGETISSDVLPYDESTLKEADYISSKNKRIRFLETGKKLTAAVQITNGTLWATREAKIICKIEYETLYADDWNLCLVTYYLYRVHLEKTKQSSVPTKVTVPKLD